MNLRVVLWLCAVLGAGCAPDSADSDGTEHGSKPGDATPGGEGVAHEVDQTPGLTQAAVLAAPSFITGVNTHNYVKPSSYGYLAADGGDRMGNGITTLGVHYVRGPLIGDVAFLTRLKSFGVTTAILGLDAKSYGKPFDPAKLKAALALSVAEAKRIGLAVVVEGLNEWDLFNSRSYNAGVIPSGMTNSGFIALTQRTLYEAAHPLGIAVLGPSVGHPQDANSLAMFPDVSAYVDVLNIHLYFGTSPETLPVAGTVQSHQRFQGVGKPVWVTETGVSSFNGVDWDQQADLITRGLTVFATGGLINAAFIYELLVGDRVGWSGWTYTPNTGETNFGVFNYFGQTKPAATALKNFISTH